MPTPQWAREQVGWSPSDEALPGDLDGVNLVLNRSRLANFLAGFAEDKDVRDLLMLDLLASAAGFLVSSTGVAETGPSLPLRPFRLWEYVWLYKALGLSAGGLKVLDLGGPATPISLLAALAGCHVTSIDINAEAVESGRECTRSWNLHSFEPMVGDMRDLSPLYGQQFDVIMSCSVLEHLTANDQETALGEIARVLSPGGMVGLTFDYGKAAPGVNRYLPPPHDPPGTAAEAARRWSKGGLTVIGNPFVEEPGDGVLFHDDVVRYTIASLFLSKPPARAVSVPRCELEGSALGSLVVDRLPFRLYQAVIHSEKAAAEQRLQLHAEFERIAREKDARADFLEQAAAERLAAMIEKDRAMAELRRELDRLAARRRAGSVDA